MIRLAVEEAENDVFFLSQPDTLLLTESMRRSRSRLRRH